MLLAAIEPHPDQLTDWIKAKKLRRGGKQAIEDQAIAEYMMAYNVVGKEEAEKIFFSFFNNGTNGKETVLPIK